METEQQLQQQLKLAEYNAKMEQLLKRKADFEAQLDQKYLQISKAAQSEAKYLVMSGSNYPIPMKRIEIRGDILSTVCAFEMVQEYVNIENIPIETDFLFPKDHQTIISRITCEIKLPDGTSKLIETKITEQREA